LNFLELQVQEEESRDEIRRKFEATELAKSLVVVLNSRRKSGDYGYIFESHLGIEKVTHSNVDFRVLPVVN